MVVEYLGQRKDVDTYSRPRIGVLERLGHVYPLHDHVDHEPYQLFLIGDVTVEGARSYVEVRGKPAHAGRDAVDPRHRQGGIDDPRLTERCRPGRFLHDTL